MDTAEPTTVGIINRENWIGALPAPVREAIEARMTRFTVAPGMPVKRAGEAATRIFQVETGFLSLIGLHVDGRQALITIYAAGNCFSETAMIVRREHNHTTIALTPAVVRQLERDDFWELYHRHPEIPEALCRKFAEAISRQMASREQRATQRLGQRIATMFANLAEHAGESVVGGETRILLPITQSNIADIFDVTRQSVHREVSHLKQLGIVDKRHGDWVVIDSERLRQICSY
ncbi:Crp/Fnr family transcriptional regulator [Sphingomonas sp. So64.6b]|uniref:Crp/Fnr family transcriptional regulator n=1 Tax=Sphingomonas sp. So64.6b TaxID=2997354 RepID=UPI001601ADCE|nr:Crp/Fnr family transcriptional regulator [Sphingomonas sp. So64.6b]QNA82882.1 Crp/Fnr family transcriptional regulator [Sphingomonas sp. So64.6b]